MGKMPTEKDCAIVKKSVEEVSRMLFPELDIVRVEVRDDFGRFDMDGDPLYVVRVIFDNPYEELDAKRTWETVRHLRPKLDELGIEGYPLVDYLSTEMVERREKLEKQKKLERLKEYERKKNLERRG